MNIRTELLHELRDTRRDAAAVETLAADLPAQSNDRRLAAEAGRRLRANVKLLQRQLADAGGR